MKKKNTQRLVPGEDTLEHICERANYLSYCQKNFQMREHPSPIGKGWDIINSKCRPIRNRLPPLPTTYECQQMVDDDCTSSSDDGDSDTDSSSTDSEAKEHF